MKNDLSKFSFFSDKFCSNENIKTLIEININCGFPDKNN